MMKKSYFIEQHIPQYIKDQFPLFVSLLKGYYEYLDRAENELVSVHISNPGQNYKTPILNIYVLDIADNSPTYGTYILDSRPIELVPIIKSGRFDKVIVKNSKGVKYKKDELLIIVIQAAEGSGAILEPVILFDTGNIYNQSQLVPFIRDIDTTNEIFKNYIYNELMPSIPVSLYSSSTASVEKEKFIKFIKQIYNSKGIEGVFNFIYKILYNSSVEFYYPKTDILRVSDGVWIKNYWVVLDPVSGLDVNTLVGFAIRSSITEKEVASIVSVEPHPTLTGKWKLLIKEITGSFSVDDFNTNYSSTIGQIISVINEEGYYYNDNGQLSSRKKIQDDYYYQEFSYELQSEYNIKEFSLILEELLHPAGFKYFIKIILELIASENSINLSSNLYYNNIKYPDIEVVSGEDASLYKKMLGMTVNDLYTETFTRPLDVSTLSKSLSNLTVGTPTDIATLYNVPSSGYILDKTNLYGYSIKIDTTTPSYRTIIKSFIESDVNKIQLDSNFTPTATDLTATIFPGYYPQAVAGQNITLSPYDPFNINSKDNTSDPEARYLRGYLVVVLHGPSQGEVRKIIAYNGTTRTIKVDSAFTNLTTTSVYRIIKDIGAQYYFGAKVESVTVHNGGSNYSATPTVLIDPPLWGTAPTFSVTVVGGVITSITISAQGTGYYYETPFCKIQDSTGTGCSFELNMGFDKNNSIQEYIGRSRMQGAKFEINNYDNYYKQAEIKVDAENGFIQSTSIYEQGNGYWFSPRNYQVVGDGTGGTISLTITNKKLTNTLITNYGTDYSYDPTFIIEAPHPTSGLIVQRDGAYGTLLHRDNNKIYIINKVNNFEKVTGDATISGVNISSNDLQNIGVFTTKYLQIKYSYMSEIEEI